MTQIILLLLVWYAICIDDKSFFYFEKSLISLLREYACDSSLSPGTFEPIIIHIMEVHVEFLCEDLSDRCFPCSWRPDECYSDLAHGRIHRKQYEECSEWRITKRRRKARKTKEKLHLPTLGRSWPWEFWDTQWGRVIDRSHLWSSWIEWHEGRSQGQFFHPQPWISVCLDALIVIVVWSLSSHRYESWGTFDRSWHTSQLDQNRAQRHGHDLEEYLSPGQLEGWYWYIHHW